MKSKKINIVTINFNNKEGLERTIKSVINQTYFDKINYIVIDGGSTDGSKDILEKYKQYFSYYTSRKDKGRYNAMNKGINKAVGDYILFLNSGDYLHDNNVLETIYDALDGTTDIIYGTLNVHASQGRQFVIGDYDYDTERGLPHPATFIKLSLMKNEKYREDYNIISDWIFFYEQIHVKGTKYKRVPTLISDFFLNGISADPNACMEEKKKYFDTVKKNDEEIYNGPISIVIPCYNQAKYVRDTIISVKASRYKDFCCVIVNDGSTDNSEEIILDEIRGDDRFKYFKVKNQGVSHARNFGISKTKSKYIMCLDSDDLISPYYIGEGVEFLDKYKDFSLFYGTAKFFYDNGKETDWNARPYSYKALLLTNMIYCAHIFRRSDYDKTTGFDESMRGFEDWEFLVRLLDNNSNVYKTNNTVFYYRRHQDSLDHEVKDRRSEFLLTIFEKNKEKYVKNNIMVMKKGQASNNKKEIGDKCCIVIPTYKYRLEGNDEKSFLRALKVFKNRDIKLVIPNSISTEYYDKYEVEYVKVDPSWMSDIKAYNRMCTNSEFYKLFKDYDYMLIYQTDCWAYEDRLDEFMRLNYEYYGAPWPQYKNLVGNGGFSLRAVGKMIELTEKHKYDGRFNEDGWFCLTHRNELDICPFDIACNFSMELVTKNILRTIKTAPMGLHGKELIPLWEETTDKLIAFKNKITSQQ